MRLLRIVGLLLVASVSYAQSLSTEEAQGAEPANPPLTADAIMARVATNQDRSETLRKQYIYRQHTHILTHKPRGRLLREETADYDVLPTADGTQKELKLLTAATGIRASTRRFRGNPSLRRTVLTVV